MQLPPIIATLEASASQFVDKLQEARDSLGELSDSTDNLDLAQARAEATSTQLADAQERLAGTSADLIATQQAINDGTLEGEAASSAQAAALERQTAAEAEVADATDANAMAQRRLVAAQIESGDTGVLQDERLIKAGKLVTMAFLGVGAAVAGISVKLAMDFQSSQAKVQAAAGMSTKQINDLGNALLGTAGSTEQSANAMLTALVPVAGQFKSLQSGAWTTADALEEVKAAATLADAGLGSISDTTGDLAGIMQAFQLKAKDAAVAADILYSASEITGQGIDSLTSGLERTRTKLGALAPPLGQLAGLLVDMTEHGETGRAAMSMLTTTMTALLKPTAAAAKAQIDLKASLDAMPPSLQSLADEYLNGALTGKSLTTATQGMSTANAALWKSFVSAADGMRTANLASKELGLTVLNNKGQFVGMGSVIGQLQEKLKGMSNAQAVAELTALGFGSSSAKLLAIVRAGPEAYDKATAAVEKHGAASFAAALQQKTLGGMLHVLASAVDDYGVRLGRVLIPKIEAVYHGTQAVVEWFEKNKQVAITLGAIITGVLAVAVTSFAVNSLGKLITNAKAAYEAILKMFGLSGGPSMTPMTDDATEAADALKAGAVTAGQTLITDARTAAQALVTGGTTTAEDVGAGGSTAAADLGAGGAAAAEDLGAGGATAAEDLGASSADAAENLGAGGAAGAEDLGAGGAAAAEDLGAGGAAAAEDLGAGGAAAGEDLGAGGTAAAEDIGAGGAAAAEDLGAGGEAAGEDVGAGGAAAAEDLGAGGIAASEDVAAGGAAGGEDIAAGGAAAAEDVVAGGAGAAEDIAAGGASAGEDEAAGGAAAGDAIVAGGAGLGAGGVAAAGGFRASSLILPLLAAQIASMGSVKLPGAAAGEAAMPSWLKDISDIPFLGAPVKVGADIGGAIADALGKLPKTPLTEKQIAANANIGSYDTGKADISLTKAQQDQVRGLMKMGESLKEAQAKVLGVKTSADKTTTAVNSLGPKFTAATLKLAKPSDMAAVKDAALKLAKPVDVAKVTGAVVQTTAAVHAVKTAIDSGKPVNVSGDVHVTLVADGRTLATVVKKYLLQGARGTGNNVFGSSAGSNKTGSGISR
jgi:hypothetical protein